MKLQYLYLLIGGFTLALNIALTSHIIFKNSVIKSRESCSSNEFITFRLSGGDDASGTAALAVTVDDTVPLE